MSRICDLIDTDGQGPKTMSDRWGTVLGQLEKEDKETIEAWKDELNNLLVFVSTLLPFLVHE